MQVTAVILAGGGSTRMGRDKAAIEVAGRTLLQRVIDAAAEAADQTVVVLAPGQSLPPLEPRGPLRLTTDAVADQGPLSGLLAGLEVVEGDVALVIACDQPFVRPALLRMLTTQAAEAPAVLPMFDGRPQPLCAAVRTDQTPLLREAYARGGRAASALADLPGAVLLPPAVWHAADAEGVSFIGANTPDDLVRCEATARLLG